MSDPKYRTPIPETKQKSEATKTTPVNQFTVTHRDYATGSPIFYMQTKQGKKQWWKFWSKNNV